MKSFFDISAEMPLSRLVFFAKNNQFYLQMTITGNNFYTSSKDAFYLVQRNNNAYSSIKGLGDFITFLGELYIILITTIIFFIGMIEYYEEDLEISLEVSAVIFLFFM